MAEAIVPAVIGGGLSFLGSSKAAGATEDAARTASQAQLEATRLGIEAQREMFDISRGDIAPWRQYGVAGLEQLGAGFGLQREQAPTAPTGTDVVPSGGGPGRTRADARAAAEEAGIERYRSGFLGSPNDPFNDLGGSNIGPIGLMENPGYEQYVNRYLAGEVGEDPTGTGDGDIIDAEYRVVDSGEGGEFTEPILFEPGEFTEEDLLSDPSYQFRRDEGLKAIERGAAAGGFLASGRTGKGLARYASDLASTEYGNAYNRWYGSAYDKYRSRVSDRTDRFNRLAALSGIGQTAASQQAGLAGQTGQTIASLYGQSGANQSNIAMGAGNTLAGLYANQGATAGNAVTQGYQNYQAQQNQNRFMGMLDRYIGGGGSPVTGTLSLGGGGTPTLTNPMG